MATAAADDASKTAVEYDATNLQEARQKYEFFWKSASPYSQWYMAEFEVDGQTYNCAEQFMMHQKAGMVILVSWLVVQVVVVTVCVCVCVWRE